MGFYFVKVALASKPLLGFLAAGFLSPSLPHLVLPGKCLPSARRPRRPPRPPRLHPPRLHPPRRPRPHRRF